jgi:hypothetical protein
MMLIIAMLTVLTAVRLRGWVTTAVAGQVNGTRSVP